MISHVFVGVRDFTIAFNFYSAVMKELGLVIKFQDAEKGWAGWMAADQPRPLFVIGLPYNGELATPGNGQMTALLASSRASVQRCFDVAMANGASSEGEPGLRPHYHPNYFGAYFRDPDGNKICICCHHADQ